MRSRRKKREAWEGDEKNEEGDVGGKKNLEEEENRI